MTDAPIAGRPSRWARPLIGPFTLRHIASLAAVLLGAAAVLLLLSTPIASPAAPALPVPGSGFYRLGPPTTGLAVGQRAPELEGEANGQPVVLRDLDGQVVRLDERRGGPVWLSFFATWCPPCQEETPVLREAYDRYASRGLEMLAVSVQETTVDDVRAYAETYALPYPIAFDASSGVFRTYQGFGLPTHVFLDGEGIIRSVYYGPLSLPDVERIVEPLLAEAGAGQSGGDGS